MNRIQIFAVMLGLCMVASVGHAAKRSTKSASTHYLYAAKFVCGEVKDGSYAEGFAPGRYETAVNLINLDVNGRASVNVRATYTRSASQGGSGGTSGKDQYVLHPLEALRLTCEDIRSLLKVGPKALIDGYLLIESSRHLDVTAVYTLAGEKVSSDFTGNQLGTGISIDVEQIPAKKVSQSKPSDPKCKGSVTLSNRYRITCLGVHFNDDKSSWRYRVEELSGSKDLSNWVLELPGCAHIVSASPRPWEAVHPDPNARLNGIKWETGGGFQRGEFVVDLRGDLKVGHTSVAAKGPDVAHGTVSGPVCRH